MWNVFGYAIACAFFGSLVPSTEAAGLFGSLLGDNDNNNNNNDNNIPRIGSLGIEPIRNEHNRLNNNYNQYTNNNNQYTNNDNNAYSNHNKVNGGILSVLGVNANANRTNTNLNNLNRVSNTGQNNPSNVNEIKNQMKEAEKLLERLKQLNRLREQQKLEREKENGQGKTTPDTGKDEQGTDNNNVNMTGDDVKNAVLMSLTKKKFYFMVKPVVPENEASNQEQTMYYVD